MAHEKHEVVEQKRFTEGEAFRSGKGGFRIKVERDRGNPFKPGPLADAWTEGWEAAQAAEPPVKRVDYSEERTRSARPRIGGSSKSTYHEKKW